MACASSTFPRIAVRTNPTNVSWIPGGPDGGYPDGVFGCGHMMGGAQISTAQVTAGANANVRIVLQETPPDRESDGLRLPGRQPAER